MHSSELSLGIAQEGFESSELLLFFFTSEILEWLIIAPIKRC